jgi:hypothetical protein
MASPQRSVIWAGLLVALLGILPLGGLAYGSLTGDPASEVIPALADAGVVGTVEVPPPPVGSIDPAISRVLYAAGSATAGGEADFSELPPQVVRVLAYYEVPLLIPVGPDGAEAP